MEVIFSHLCDYAILDSTGKLSAVGIFNRINTARGATPIINGFLVAELSAPVTEGTAHNLELVIVDEDGNPRVPRLALPVKLHSGGPRRPLGGYLVLKLENLPLPGEGVFTLEFHSQGRRFGTLPLVVTFFDPPQPQAVPEKL